MSALGPVDPAVLATFLLVASLVVVSPGPDSLLILRNTLLSGRRTGFATVIGVQIGLIGHTAAAVLGLSAAVASSPDLFRLIAIAGAAYLAWLGIDSFRGRAVPIGREVDHGRIVSPGRGLRDAALTNLLNPKVILLFVALMPNFVDVARGRVPLQLLVLAIALILINIVWQTSLWGAAHGLRRHLAAPRTQRAIAWTTGAVLFGFAIAMLADHLG